MCKQVKHILISMIYSSILIQRVGWYAKTRGDSQSFNIIILKH